MSEAVLRELLDKARADGVIGRASLSVWVDGTRQCLVATDGGDGAYDIASVTKAVTAVAALQHVAPDERVHGVQGRPTVSALLSHTSGLPAWRPLFAHAAIELGVDVSTLVRTPSLHEKARAIYRRIVADTLADAARPTYSDLGFFALGEWLSERTGRPIRGLQASILPNAPRGHATGRERPRPGNPDFETDVVGRSGHDPSATDHAVDDDNAAAVGGACGHAGLFAEADAVASFWDRLRRDADDGTGGLLPPGIARELFTPIAAGRTLGLDTPTGASPAIGTILGRGPLGAAGHLGFTGCSLWIDRDRRLSVALLTDAVRLARPSPGIRLLRPAIHDALARLLGA